LLIFIYIFLCNVNTIVRGMNNVESSTDSNSSYEVCNINNTNYHNSKSKSVVNNRYNIESENRNTIISEYEK